jgi:phage repressor protein C with HTH and peptisase S24 domain
MSATEMSKRAGFPPYYVSRLETGETTFKAFAALQFAGEFLIDFREFKHEPKDDYLKIIAGVMSELDAKLYAESEEAGVELDGEVMAGDAPPPWEDNPLWRRAKHAQTIVKENNARADWLKGNLDRLIKRVEVEVAEFALGLHSELAPAEFMTDGRIELIKKRQTIQMTFEEINENFHRQEELPYIDPANRVDHSIVAILQEKFTELLADFGDDAAIAALNEKVLKNANEQILGQAEIQAFIKQGAAERKKVADSRVTPAPPPVSDARSNKKDLPVYGQARAGRDGFDLPAGAEAMSHIARPFFLDGVGTAYAVYANGDSMEPRFRHGELLFIDPSRPPKRGDDVVVQVAVGGEICGFVKRFVSASDDTTTVHQFNPDEDIKYPTPDVKAVHLVVGSLAAGR